MSFERELGLIQIEDIKEIVINALKIVPDYFYKIPASSSGKYHPQYALGEGGLYRHVQATIKIAEDLFRMEEYYFTQEEQDTIIASLILHDCWKQGEVASGNTVHEHPEISATKVYFSTRIKSIDQFQYLMNIYLNILSHMGQWTTNKYSKVVLKRPTTRMQKFVHLCDYLASRRDIEVVLEAPIEEKPKELIASEALFGFAAWLTSREEQVKLSANDEAGVIARLVDQFCKANNLPEPRKNWANNLNYPKE